MSRFAPIPDVPEGTPPDLAVMLRAIKQNIELLTGQAGIDKRGEAIRYGSLGTADLAQQSSAAAASPPTKAEFDAAVADIEAIVKAHNYLAAQLRGEEAGM